MHSDVCRHVFMNYRCIYRYHHARTHTHTHTRTHTSKDGSVCAGVHPRFSIEYVLTCLHVWMDARVFVWAHRGHRYRCACARGQMTRVSMGARESSAVHRSKYMSMCVYIDLHLDPCVWSGLEPRVGACACADVRARALHLHYVQSPFRMHRCVYHAHAGVSAGMRGHLLWIRGPVRAHGRALCGRTRVLCAAGTSPSRR